MILGGSFVTLILAMTGAGDSSVVAAWVQAVGSILAIGGGVYAVQYQHGLERAAAEEDRLLGGQGLAAALFPEFLELDVVIETLITRLQQVLGSDAKRLASAFSNIQVSVPEVLGESWKYVHLLGRPAGPTVAQLAAVVRQYNRLAEDVQRQLNRYDVDGEEPHPALSLMQHLEVADRLVKSAIEEIKPIHDLPIERPAS